MEEAKKFNAILTDGQKPYHAELEGRELEKDEVLVKVHAAPINPSDQGYCVGRYGGKNLPNPFPTGCGFEGAGEVVDAHESAKELLGKRVALSQSVQSKGFQGTWRQYVWTDKSSVIPFPDSLDYEKFASSFVNPLTVLNMEHYAKTHNHKAIIHSAACSNLGKMLVKHCKKVGLTLINIVRREEQVKMLSELGAEHILDSTSDTFEKDLADLTAQHEATGFFDAVAGDLTGQVLEAMPDKSTAYVYGGLSGKAPSTSISSLIFGMKTISYLWLSAWIKEITEDERNQAFGTVIQDLCTGGEVFGTTVFKTFPLSKFAEAREAASKNGSDGKVMFKPQE